MPCDASHCEHTGREAESGRVLEFLKEIHGQPFNHEQPSYYGNVETLDDDTARLCAHLTANGVTGLSLELQLWWKRHQAADQRRIEREQLEAAERDARKRALAKLTPEEIAALRIK